MEKKLIEVSDQVEAKLQQHAEDPAVPVENHKFDSKHLHDCVLQAIRVIMTNDKEEDEETKKRKVNFIILGLEESGAASANDSKAQDEDLIVNVLHEIKCDTISVANMVRLGTKQDGGKPRPIKLTLQTEQKKECVLLQAKNLRRCKGREKVFIHQDLTPTQRLKHRNMILELKEKEKKWETLIANGKIFVRRQKTIKETSNSDVSTPTQIVLETN